jgi:hypothetical protein
LYTERLNERQGPPVLSDSYKRPGFLQKLAQPEDFDFLHRIGEGYATLRRYKPEFLEVLKFRAAPAAEGVLEAIGMLRGMNAENDRKIPAVASSAAYRKSGMPHRFRPRYPLVNLGTRPSLLTLL